MQLEVNGRSLPVDDAAIAPQMPLLWVLRDVLQLTGTKYGCGVGACGACTVWVDGQAVRSCQVAVGTLAGKAIRTIEGLGTPEAPHPLQRAWIEHQVPQCGWCQSGLLMAAAALLAKNPQPSDAELDAGLTNLCRCGSLPRARQALRGVAAAALPTRK